jgi:hypothetical protein
MRVRQFSRGSNRIGRMESFTVFMVVFKPVPELVDRHMRTVEVETDNGPQSLPNDFPRRVSTLLQEIAAACRAFDASRGHPELGVAISRNLLNGRDALIVRRLLPDGRYSRAMAELLSETGELDEHARAAFDAFAEAAAAQRLEVVAHDERGELGCFATFAAVRDRTDSDHFYYLARLLILEPEVRQWTDVRLESRAPASSADAPQ